jgi:hypothetical protein
MPTCEIRVRGLLSDAVLSSLGMSADAAGSETVLRGSLADQVQLHRLLDRIALLGLELVELRWDAPRRPSLVGPDAPESLASPDHRRDPALCGASMSAAAASGMLCTGPRRSAQP